MAIEAEQNARSMDEGVPYCGLMYVALPSFRRNEPVSSIIFSIILPLLFVEVDPQLSCAALKSPIIR